MIPKQHKVTPEQAGRVDLVVAAMTGIARRNLRGMFDCGAVKVNGGLCEGPWVRVAVGDVVDVEHDPRKKLPTVERAWKDAAFSIVFEDEHLIIVDKSASIVTVPVSKGQTNTLVHRIAAYLRRGRGDKRPAHIVHRLDQGVSGLLVFAKSEQVAERLRGQFESRKPERQYTAIVAGRVTKDQGTFRSLLATDERLNRYSTQDEKKGELAITHYKVVGPVRKPGPAATVVEVQLETGRRNQIRVHFAEAGHPVLGDRRYEPDKAKHPQWKARRLALHAATLGFIHPVTGLPVRFISPLPDPMRRLVEEKD